MKTRLLLVAAVIALSSIGCARRYWQNVSENGFTVSMPGVPTRGQQSTSTAAGPITISTYVVEFKNEAFTVVCTDYPTSIAEKLTDIEKFLDGGRTGAIASFNGALTEEHPVKLANYTGREFSADATAKGATVTDRILWATPRLYQVIYERPKGLPIGADGQKFLDSFIVEAAAAPPSTQPSPAVAAAPSAQANPNTSPGPGAAASPAAAAPKNTATPPSNAAPAASR